MSKPLLILKSPLTKKYYATRSYKYLDEVSSNAVEVTGKKEDITEQIEAYIKQELLDQTAEMQAAIVELRDLLNEVRNGLEWYRDEYPQDASEADNEMLKEIDKTLNDTEKWSGDDQ